MTMQEINWCGVIVLLFTLQSKQGKIHTELSDCEGLVGRVEREAKNGMLLVRFFNRKNTLRSVPASCLEPF